MDWRKVKLKLEGVCAGPLGASWSRKLLATNRQERKDSMEDILGFSPRSVSCYLNDSKSRVFKLGHAFESRAGQGEGCDNTQLGLMPECLIRWVRVGPKCVC